MTPLPTETMGQAIARRRNHARLSLRELGRLTGLSAPFLSDMEHGRRFPTDDALQRIATALTLDLHELRACDPRPPLREMQDMCAINPKWAFAFRRIVLTIRSEGITPQQLVDRMEIP